jgi:hypothetical protein
MTRPQSSEAADYYFKYIDLITSDDIVPAFKDQMGQTLEFLERISEQQSLHAYAPGKWTIREVLSHLNDGELVFLGRAFWFARGFEDPLPSFDQDIAVQHAHANETSWAELVEEFKNLRAASISFFKNLPPEAWSRTGVASDNPVTVRALAYIMAGHVAHHTNVLQEKYLAADPRT